MKKKEKKEINVKQEQIHDILFNREIGWQEIIYDLINTEQLDPWDIDITVLSQKYLEKIKELEEADFFVSSKVLLAASLLLRIKSEILLNKYVKNIDEILFGKKEKKQTQTEKIELELTEFIPELIPRTPIPRFKKVTLNQLVESLSKAITTENRRIKKEIINKNALRESSISLPKKTFSIKDKIKEIYSHLFKYFSINKNQEKLSFTELTKKNKEKKLHSFFPLLQLENQQKIWLQQDAPFEEIHIWMKKTFLKHNPDPFEDLKEKFIPEKIKNKQKT